MDTVMGGSDGSRLGCVAFVCNNNNAVRLVGPRNLIIGDDTHRWYYFFFFFLYSFMRFFLFRFFGGKGFNFLKRWF